MKLKLQSSVRPFGVRLDQKIVRNAAAITVMKTLLMKKLCCLPDRFYNTIRKTHTRAIEKHDVSEYIINGAIQVITPLITGVLGTGAMFPQGSVPYYHPNGVWRDTLLTH